MQVQGYCGRGLLLLARREDVGMAPANRSRHRWFATMRTSTSVRTIGVAAASATMIRIFRYCLPVNLVTSATRHEIATAGGGTNAAAGWLQLLVAVDTSP